MKRLLSLLLISLFTTASADVPFVDAQMLSTLTKSLESFVEEDSELITKDLWQTYPCSLSSGLICRFDMPSAPRGVMLTEEFYVLTSMDSAGHLYLVHFTEDFPFDSVTLEAFVTMMVNQLTESGLQILYCQRTVTSQGNNAADLAVYNSQERSFTKFRFIELADGTLAWMFTVSMDRWDQHDRFVGSFLVNTY